MCLYPTIYSLIKYTRQKFVFRYYYTLRFENFSVEKYHLAYFYILQPTITNFLALMNDV